jgi:hypothetical protein
VDPQGELKRAYEKSVSMSWAMIAALVLYPLTVEVVRMSNASFSGFDPHLAGQSKDFIYGIAILLPLCIRTLRKVILKRGRPSDLATLARRLLVADAFTMLIAQVPAVLGLLLFLLGGLYKEFYISIGYSALVMAAYFPRYNQRERLLTRGV